MNPFTGTLNRTGFLVWSILLSAWVVGFGLLIDATKAHHVGVYWMPLRIFWAIVLVIGVILINVRRLQNAGLSSWLVLLQIVPFIGTVFWIALYFIPPKKLS